MIEKLIICGDSYASGIGLDESYNLEKSFGGLISEKLNISSINYSRAGICNFGIFLQVKKSIEDNVNNLDKSLIIISLTQSSRLMIASENITSTDLNLSNVDYINNRPFSYNEKRKRDVPFTLNKNPKLFSQTILDVLAHLNNKVSGAMESAYKILPKYKIETLGQYIQDVYSDPIKDEYDVALVARTHLLLKMNNIKHMFLGTPRSKFDFVPDENFCEVNWREISDKYPDEIGSSHCNEIGHEIVRDLILNKISNE